MPLPDLNQLCLECVVPPQKLCVTMPGGASLCVNLPDATPPNASEVARAMLAQVNAALTPLTPLFNIIDAVVSIVACVQAIPDAIIKLDPSGIIQCVPEMVQKLSKLLAIIPPLSIPITIRDILAVIIAFLSGLKSDLEDAKIQLNRILVAQLKAAQPGNSKLLDVISCAQATFDAMMAHIREGAAPLNRLIGLLNALLGLVPGVDPIPCLGSVEGLPQPVIDTLTTFIDVLTIVRNILPGGLKINLYTPKGANCV